MRKIFYFILVGVFAVGVPGVCAQNEAQGSSEAVAEQKAEKGATQSFSDWVATVGRPDKKKEQILAKREERRHAKKMQKELRLERKKAKKLDKEVKKGKKKVREAPDTAEEEIKRLVEESKKKKK